MHGVARKASFGMPGGFVPAVAGVIGFHEVIQGFRTVVENDARVRKTVVHVRRGLSAGTGGDQRRDWSTHGFFRGVVGHFHNGVVTTQHGALGMVVGKRRVGREEKEEEE